MGCRRGRRGLELHELVFEIDVAEKRGQRQRRGPLLDTPPSPPGLREEPHVLEPDLHPASGHANFKADLLPRLRGREPRLSRRQLRVSTSKKGWNKSLCANLGEERSQDGRLVRGRERPAPLFGRTFVPRSHATGIVPLTLHLRVRVVAVIVAVIGFEEVGGGVPFWLAPSPLRRRLRGVLGRKRRKGRIPGRDGGTMRLDRRKRALPHELALGSGDRGEVVRRRVRVVVGIPIQRQFPGLERWRGVLGGRGVLAAPR